MAGGGFLEGFAQGVQNLPQMMMQKQHLDLEKQQEQRLANSQSRAQIAKTLEAYDNIINYVPDDVKPQAIKLWISSVEQQTGQKLTPEIKSALSSGSPELSKALTQTFISNPDINGTNLGQALNNEALMGVLIAHGKKQTEQQQAQALADQGQYALTGQMPQQAPTPAPADQTAQAPAPSAGDATDVTGAPAPAPAAGTPAPAGTPTAPQQAGQPGQQGQTLPGVGSGKSRGLPITTQIGRGAGISPEDTGALVAKRDRLELLLANPAIPDKLRASYEKILSDTNAQLATSVDEKNQTLAVARELQLNPALPAHQALINQVIMARKAQAAGAEETAKQNAQPVPLDVARATGASPFANREEARAAPGAKGVTVLSEAQLAGAKTAAEEGAKPIDLGLARETGTNPLMNRSEARKVYGSEGLQLPTEADKAAAGEQVKNVAEGFKQYAQAGRDAASRGPARDQLRALLPFATTGMGAGQRAQLDRLASMFGVTDTKKLDATQVVDMISKHLALANRKDMPGSLSDADREFLINTEPNISKEKNAIYIKLAMDDILDKRLQDRAAAIPQYQRVCGLNGQKCGGRTFDEEWQKFVDSHPLLPKFQGVLHQYGVAPSAPQAAPAQGGAVAGTAAPAAAPVGQPGAQVYWQSPSMRKKQGGQAPAAAQPPAMTEEQAAEINGENGYLDRVKRQVINSFKF